MGIGFLITVPEVKHPFHYLFFVLNCIVAGLGTLLSGFFGDRIRIDQMIIGVLFFFVPFKLGLVFSVFWGFMLLRKGRNTEPDWQGFNIYSKI